LHSRDKINEQIRNKFETLSYLCDFDSTLVSRTAQAGEIRVHVTPIRV